MNVNDALETFLDSDAFYGGGLANHGPIAVEALEHLEVRPQRTQFQQIERPYGLE